MVTNDARWPTAGAGVLVALALIGQGAIARQPAPVDLTKARAHWVDTDTILWDVSDPGLSVRLHVAPPGGHVASGAGLSDAPTITLARDPPGPSTTVREAFPHLARLAAFRIPADALTAAHAALTGHPFVSAASSDGEVVSATGLQIGGVLDALHTYDGPLGVSIDQGAPTLRLWAPTAQHVSLLLYDDSEPATLPSEIPMERDARSGVWSAAGQAAWLGRFYNYRVRVFVPAEDRIADNVVTDPYSVSLSVNSARSQIVDLRDPALAPDGWARLRKPALEAPEDISIYELHVRDFSASDPLVPEALRGTFEAFTLRDTYGGRHLDALARAGLTHVHLLPTFDIATIDERRSAWASPGDLSRFAPDGTEQQAAVSAIASRDPFNWGYDPWHYSVPEGSYSTDPDGPRRILELRSLVQSLNERGLRVVLDVVYNHTTAAGQRPPSVLDRIVPGYYHRLSAEGAVETSTCCANTASERAMMEKLLVDSVLMWATHYKVDGFRFDLMGHHSRRTMVKVRAALDALTAARDGVHGREIYVYGEGWDFGEVAKNARGVNASQINMAGTGIGTFNDRLRDAVRGGTPFAGYQDQGLVTGLWSEPNGVTSRTPARDLRLLHALADWVKVGLAGNLADVEFVDHTGRRVTGSQVDYRGQPAGYASDPQETVNYVEAHDNETLFDVIQVKTKGSTPLGQRVRLQMLGISLVGLAQGVPFFHAGMEMLRSKSLDRNSFDSGDWFNRLDYTFSTNNWGVGLPPERENKTHWDVMRPLLADATLQPSRPEMALVFSHFREVLQVRRSSPLFRLRTAAQVQAHLRFHNTGPDQVPALIVMELHDLDAEIDPHARRVVVLFNAGTVDTPYRVDALSGSRFTLHPVLQASADPTVRRAAFRQGAFLVPARTTAVFVEPREH